MKIKQILTRSLIAFMLVSSLLQTMPVYAVTAPSPSTETCERTFFTFPAWYSGLVVNSDCRIMITKLNDIWVIAFNILNIALQIAAYTAAFIMFGMIFKMVTARGDPGKISSAGLGIRNAIIGLIIAIISVAIVQFVTNSIAGAA
jgi:hypothetical protein